MLADLIDNIRVDPPLIEHPAYLPLNLDPSGHDDLGTWSADAIVLCPMIFDVSIFWMK